jgi:thioredoxin 1
LSVSASKTGGRLIESVADYEEHVTGATERPVLVFYTAPWCGPCRLSIPVVKDVMKQFGSKVEVVEVNTDDLPDVASNSGVVSIPTIHICVGGKIVDTIIGCVAKGVLASSVEKVLEDLESGNAKKIDQ